jgi:hypothetical protein
MRRPAQAGWFSCIGELDLARKNDDSNCLEVIPFEKKRALSVPKNTGRRVLYKTVLSGGS